MLLYLRALLSEASREMVLTIFLAIDLYYRLEWFDLHTPATSFLHHFFGSGE